MYLILYPDVFVSSLCLNLCFDIYNIVGFCLLSHGLRFLCSINESRKKKQFKTIFKIKLTGITLKLENINIYRTCTL